MNIFIKMYDIKNQLLILLCIFSSCKSQPDRTEYTVNEIFSNYQKVINESYQEAILNEILSKLKNNKTFIPDTTILKELNQERQEKVLEAIFDREKLTPEERQIQLNRIIKDFLDKYSTENFDKFTGYSISFQGQDTEGYWVVFITVRDCKYKASFIVTVHPISKKVKSTSRKLLKEPCHFNEDKYISMAVSFTDYNVAILSVDKNKNIFINVVEGDNPPNLIKFSNPTSIPERYKDWKIIENNWYQEVYKPHSPAVIDVLEIMTGIDIY